MRSDDPPQRRPGNPRSRASAVRVEVMSDVGRSPLSRVQMRRLVLHVLGAERVERAHVAVALVSRGRIARLHRRFVGVPGVTDIVTLEHARAASGAPVVGEVFIAPDVARDNARSLGVPTRDEVARLVVHGVLHALGWEHPDGARRTSSPMWARQETLLRSARRAGVLSP